MAGTGPSRAIEALMAGHQVCDPRDILSRTKLRFLATGPGVIGAANRHTVSRRSPTGPGTT